MPEVESESIHFSVFSPPYFNAPFDTPDMFEDYASYLRLLSRVATELKRVLVTGRKCAWVVDDVRVDGELYPIVADTIKLMTAKGFKYRENITWLKASGYARFSHRSGHIKKHWLPTYYFPDNVKESILIFQKDKLNNGAYARTLPHRVVRASKIHPTEFDEDAWNLNVWFIPNVPPIKGRLEQGIAAFPDEIPNRLIQLYSYVGETVLDCFLGSGTTMKVARQLGRNCVGFEIRPELARVIREKVTSGTWEDGHSEFLVTRRLPNSKRNEISRAQRREGTV
jgi:DNA modification methylase